MKKSLITLAAVALVSGAAFAQDADPAGQFATQVNSSLTRAQVNAEVVAAVKAGDTSPSKIPLIGKVQPELKSGVSRAEVVAQFIADREEAEAMTAEDSGSTYLAKNSFTRDTNRVLAGSPVNAQ